MEQFLYERPREKLRNSGISSLDLVELLQLVIGNGNQKLSAARFARLIEQMLLEDEVSYESLIRIDGVGDAKACQIIALLEIARRLYGDEE